MLYQRYIKNIVFLLLFFTLSVIMIFISFLEKLFDKSIYKVKFDILPETKEEKLPIPYGWVRFLDLFWFLSNCLYSLVKTLNSGDLDFLKKEFHKYWDFLGKKLTFSYEYFSSNNDFWKSVNNLIFSVNWRKIILRMKKLNEQLKIAFF